MTPEQREEMKKVAGAASPGPWTTDTCENDGEYGIGDDTHGGFKSHVVFDAEGRSLFDTLNSDATLVEEEWSSDEDGEYHAAWDETGRKNAAFMCAFDPPTVLALLSDLEAATARAEAAEAVAREMVEALKPFAAMYAEKIADLTYDTPVTPPDPTMLAWGFNHADLTWGDLSIAHALLARAEALGVK